MQLLARITAAGTLVLAPALALAAGSWNGPFAGIQAGVNSASADNLSTEQGITAGVYGGYNFQLADHFVLGPDVFYNWNQTKSHTINGTNVSFDAGTKVYGLDVLAGFPLGQDGTWMPYAKVGYGWGDPMGDLGGGTQNSIRYGAGIAWRLSRLFSLNFQYMHQNFGSSNGNYTNDNFTVGGTFHFGTTPKAAPPPPPPPAAPPPPPAAPPPPDSDHDGVTDDMDQCPNTPANTRVDVHGCQIHRVIKLPNVHFAFDSAALTPGSQQVIDDAAATLEKYPDLKAEVAGYTDNHGPAAYNQKLSRRRAESVKQYLVAHGVSADRLTVKGYGMADPVAPNTLNGKDNPEGRAKNRRVELHILNLNDSGNSG